MMGYESSIDGKIPMTEKEYKNLKSEIQLENYLRYDYDAKNKVFCVDDEFRKHYNFDDFLNILIHHISICEESVLSYCGEDIEDHGCYYIYPGKWEYVSDKYPNPSNEFLNYYESLKKKGE